MSEAGEKGYIFFNCPKGKTPADLIWEHGRDLAALTDRLGSELTLPEKVPRSETIEMLIKTHTGTFEAKMTFKGGVYTGTIKTTYTGADGDGVEYEWGYTFPDHVDNF